MVRFGFYQKNNQTEFFFLKKKNRNRFKPTGFGSVRFSFLEKKPVQTGLARFFRFGLVFSGLARFFRFGSVLARFFSGFFFVRFGFSGSRLTKPKPNRTGRFFQMKIYTYVQADKCEDGQSVSFVNGDTNSQL
jgi:hypothetical protein